MRRPYFALLLALALMAPLTLAAAQGEEDAGRGRGRGGDSRPDDTDPAPDDGRSGRTDDPRPGEEAREPREPQGRGRPGEDTEPRGPPVGSFDLRLAQREVVGDYVSFAYSETGIHDYKVAGTPIFNLTVEDGKEKKNLRGAVARGSQIRVEMPDFTLRAHDNPGAVSRIATDSVVTFEFPAGANVSAVENGQARFRVGGYSGIVRGDDLEVTEQGHVRASGDTLVYLDTPRGAFDVHRKEIGAAIGGGRVGAEVSITRNADGLQEDSVSYGNVTMTTVKAEPGNVTVLLEGHGFDGRVVVLNVDGRILGAQRAEDLVVRFNNGTIRQADGVADVLDPDDDGLDPEYYVIFDPLTHTFQLLVSVPHYSVHTLSVGTLVIPSPPSAVAGLLLGLLVLVPSGWALFRRR